MLRPKSMSKIRIITLKNISDALISSLHMAGCIDIRKEECREYNNPHYTSSFDQLSAHLAKLRPIMSIVFPYINKKMKDKDISIPKTIEAKETNSEAEKLYPVADEIKYLEQHSLELTEQLQEIQNEVVVLDKLSDFGSLDFTFLRNSKSISFKIGTLLDQKKLYKLTERNDISIGHGKNNQIIVVYPKTAEKSIDDILADKFVNIDLPDNLTNPLESITAARSKIKKLKEELEQIDKKKESLALKNYGKLSQVIYNLEIALDEKKIIVQFGSTNRTYIIQGWIISADLEKVQKVIEEFAPNAYIEKIEYDSHHETPPTVLDNPSFLKPFEFVTKSFTFPSYSDLDPTLSYAIFLPIVYGMMVGDVIYGFISIFIALFFMSKFKQSEIVTALGKIWIISAFPTIIFGIIFNEWAAMPLDKLLSLFGIREVGVYHPLIHRMEDVMTLIVAAISMGVIHLTVGFIFGVITEWNHNKNHAYAKIGWLALMYGGIVAFASVVLSFGSIILYGGLGLLLIGVILIAKNEGLVGVIEIPGLVGNLLSYSRIAAIGIVGVVLAEILNEFLLPTPEGGILSLILLPIFLLLHTVNCFLAMFESVIQGGRLNIVEFKSKFLHGNGYSFTPFSIKNR